MTPQQFKAWRSYLDLSQQEAADILGLSKGSVQNYERGRRLDGGDAAIPKPVELACAAIALGIKAYAGPVES